MQSATVFWDFENCPVPRGMRGYQVVRKLKDYIVVGRKLQLANIIAIGNTSQLSENCKEELESIVYLITDSGVAIQHISSGKPAAADVGILGEIMKFIYFHRPPHSIFLISGDRDFSKILNFLESVHYHVVLVHSPTISDVLRYSVNDCIAWRDLLYSVSDDTIEMASVPTEPPQTIHHKKSVFVDERNLSAETLVADEQPVTTMTSNVIQPQPELKNVAPVVIARAEILSDRLQVGSSTYASLLKLEDDALAKDRWTIVHGKSKPMSVESMTTEPFADLIRCLILKGPLTVSLIGADTITRGVHKRNGFETVKAYVEAAEAANIVRLSNKESKNGQITVSLLNRSRKVSLALVDSKFRKLIQLLKRRPENKALMSLIGEDPLTRGVHKNHGFLSIKKYLEAAETAGVVRIINGTASGSIFVELIPKYCVEVGRNAAIATKFPASNPQSLPASQLEDLLNSLRQNETELLSLTDLGADPRFKGIHTKNGFPTMKKFFEAAEDAGIVVFVNKYDTNGHTLISLCDKHRNNTDFFELVKIMNEVPKERIKSQSLLNFCRGLHSKLGFKSFKDLIFKAEKMRIVRLFDKHDPHGIMSVELVEMQRVAKKSTDVSVQAINDTTPISAAIATLLSKGFSNETISDGKSAKFYWPYAAESVQVSGSWDSWSKPVNLRTFNGNFFHSSIQLQAGTYEYKFVVNDEWKVDKNQNLVSDMSNNVIVID